MIRSNRRSMLGLIMGATLAPTLLARGAQATVSPAPFTPPGLPMLYRRTMERQLADGSRILVERAYRVTFAPVAGGFQVEGEALSTRVDAPPSLAAFARMEEQRVETGAFPLRLDRFGQILGDESAAPGNADLQAAFAEAHALITRHAAADAERQELSTFVTALHQAGARIAAFLPPDLFAPDGAERSEDRAIALPTGNSGRIVSRFAGERDPGTGLMKRARREVLTEYDRDTRLTVERWKLQQA